MSKPEKKAKLQYIISEVYQTIERREPTKKEFMSLWWRLVPLPEDKIIPWTLDAVKNARETARWLETERKPYSLMKLFNGQIKKIRLSTTKK